MNYSEANKSADTVSAEELADLVADPGITGYLIKGKPSWGRPRGLTIIGDRVVFPPTKGPKPRYIQIGVWSMVGNYKVAGPVLFRLIGGRIVKTPRPTTI